MHTFSYMHTSSCSHRKRMQRSLSDVTSSSSLSCRSSLMDVATPAEFRLDARFLSAADLGLMGGGCLCCC